jgi:hypothetical protein
LLPVGTDCLQVAVEGQTALHGVDTFFACGGRPESKEERETGRAEKVLRRAVSERVMGWGSMGWGSMERHWLPSC